MFDYKKVINQLLIERDMSLSQLAQGLDMQTQSLRNKLNRGNFGLSDYLKMLDLLDCDLRVVTRDTKKEFY